ncbi:WEB family At5g55860 [Olea europaea subsp. europaea]|uniref:WEB family At5g55860 n=1 Tax=Olea europaea subsp. europaea TaxID=158383 RepID=A0A8S0SRH5_OLEEU|nr:WEB family At5g55860 [Olea europaea subsp. europaea]
MKERETGTESTAGNLHVNLRKAKSEQEEAFAEEAKLSGVSDEMISTIYQLSLESESAKHEVEETKCNTEELKKEAEVAKIELEAAETKLKVALNEAEEVKAADARALNQISMLSEKINAACSPTKVAAAIAQVETVRASDEEALKKLEASQKEIEDMKTANHEVLKKAEMAEAAKKAVEGELRRWRDLEQNKAVEAASQVLAETEKTFESSLQNYQIRKYKSAEEVLET